MVNQWCEQVGEKNCQHHTFGEGGVNDADQDNHTTDQQTKNELAGIGQFLVELHDY